MSKRRGKILQDAESIERRKWYSDLQQATMNEVARENSFHKSLHQQEALDNQEKIRGGIPTITLADNPWVTALNAPVSTNAVVVGFHGIGQNQSLFKRWHKTLSDDNILLCGVCLPGRSYRAGESYADSIRNLSVNIFMLLKAAHIIHRPIEDGGNAIKVRPLVLLGHDIGALIAYEIAKLLQDYGYHLTALLAASAPSPYLQGQNKLGKKYCFLSDTELLQRMQVLGGVPALLRERKEFLKYFIPLFRSDYFLYDKYVIQPPAKVLYIPEAQLEASLDLTPAVREPPVMKKGAFGRATSEEEVQQVEQIYPVVLYRLHCEVVTIRVDDDPFVTAKEVSEWAHMSNRYDHVTLAAVGPGSHCGGLCTPENENVISELLKRCCTKTTLEVVTAEDDD